MRAVSSWLNGLKTGAEFRDGVVVEFMRIDTGTDFAIAYTIFSSTQQVRKTGKLHFTVQATAKVFEPPDIDDEA